MKQIKLKNTKAKKLKSKQAKKSKFKTRESNQKAKSRKLKMTKNKKQNELKKTQKKLKTTKKQNLRRKSELRILSEEDSQILLFDGSFEKSDDRGLQEATPDASNTTKLTNSALKTKKKTPSAQQFIGNANLKLYKFLLENIETLSLTTREDTANHDEIETARVNYISFPPTKNIKNMKPDFKDTGLNLLELVSKINFDMTNIEKVVIKGGEAKTETLSGLTLKEVVQVDFEDLTMFQADVDLEFDDVLLMESPVLTFQTNSETNFANSPPIVSTNSTNKQQCPGQV